MSLLERFPRYMLGHWPTPLERLDRLGPPELWIKRDDCTGLAAGGNKTRKLEFHLGKALAEGAERVATFGALQSNHARQTAAACAKAGLRCDLILSRAVPKDDHAYTRSGNLLLDGLFGANVHVADNAEEVVRILSGIETEGEQLFVIPPGGSDVTGTLGYVIAAFEIKEQSDEAGAEFDRIVVAASTCGTAAGLIVGASIAGLDSIVDVVCVYEPADDTADTLRSLLTETSAELGVEVPSEDRWTITDSELGEGYGITTEASRSALAHMASEEGILLDPVYTSKAFAYLLSAASGRRSSDERVLFVHTGGVPGLFAYPEEFGRMPPGAIE